MMCWETNCCCPVKRGDPTRSETENLVSLAHSRKLKIIALEKLELFDDNDVDVLYLSEI